jgi:hypothetical protein
MHRPLVDAYTVHVQWQSDRKRYLVVVAHPNGTARKWRYAGEELRGAPSLPVLDALLNAVCREIDAWLC